MRPPGEHFVSLPEMQCPSNALRPLPVHCGLSCLQPGEHYVSLPEVGPVELHKDVFPKIKEELKRLEQVG